MIYVYELEPDDDVIEFTMNKFLECMSDEKVWTFNKLAGYDMWHAELLDFKDKRRREFMVFDSDTGILKYMWLELGLRTLKEQDIAKVTEEKLAKYRELEEE